MMILLDFDGTLVDLWPRYWSVFKDILNVNIQLSDYKKLKQLYKKDSELAATLGYSLPKDYFEMKKILLEEMEYLEKDKLFWNVKYVNSLFKKRVMILTKRRNEDNFKKQINRIGIECVYRTINYNKSTWIENNCPKDEKIIIIGDSLEELEASRLENVEAWLVGYGLSTKNDFDKMKIPYRYFANPSELKTELSKESVNGPFDCHTNSPLAE